MTLQEFWNDNDCTHVWIASTAQPAGVLYQHSLDQNDSYCNIHDLLDEDLSPRNLWELEGEVQGNEWHWDGEGKVWDYYGNDITKLVVYCRSKN